MCVNTFTKASCTASSASCTSRRYVIGDSHGPPLLARDELAVPFARSVAFAAGDESLDLGRQLRVPRQRRNRCDGTDAGSRRGGPSEEAFLS